MNIEDIIHDLKEHADDITDRNYRDQGQVVRTAASILGECFAAGFITLEGEVRKVVRRVDVGRHPSDDLDFIVDVLDSGQVVFVCEAARKAGEAAQ